MADLEPPTGPRTVCGPGLIGQQKRTFKIGFKTCFRKKEEVADMDKQ